MWSFEAIYSFYSDLINHGVSTYAAEPTKLILPTIPFTTLRELLRASAATFVHEDTILKIDDDLVIVGDIHGQILDLFRILSEFGRPPLTRYLFLGDIVDRGPFSTETAVLILTMKVLWPSSVFVIRGNHECSELWGRGGFARELESLYPSLNATLEFVRAFAMMPLGAVVNGKILCLHGGIGPRVSSIAALAKITRPLMAKDVGPVLDVLWSDPREFCENFFPSTRGSGHFFGSAAISNFLLSNNAELLIRGHECEDAGFAYHLGGKVLTVFSASGYCNVTGNMSGVVLVKKGRPPSPRSFPVLRWILRAQVRFLRFNSKSPSESGKARVSALPRLSSKDTHSATKISTARRQDAIEVDKHTKSRMADLQSVVSLSVSQPIIV
jgi:protein phosphatase